jgi:sn-glycerol 3-phosphate transport system permease protein
MSTFWQQGLITRLFSTAAAWLLGLLWLLPLLFAAWAAFHSSANTARLDLLAPLTLDNFATAWSAAPLRDILSTRLYW